MILQKGDLTRTVSNKDIAKILIEKCGYKEVKEVKEVKEAKPEENKPKESNK